MYGSSVIKVRYCRIRFKHVEKAPAIFFQIHLHIHQNSSIFVPPKWRSMSDGVTGNTSDFGSEESRFEPWSDNKNVNPGDNRD